MKPRQPLVVAFYALPFHRWVLASTVAAVRANGVEVAEVEHVPAHPHDWATADGSAALAALRACSPGARVVLVADYPYPPVRGAALARVCSVRHSLASRGNTYERDQFLADYLLPFSSADAAELGRRAIQFDAPRPLAADTGCPWAGDVLAAAAVPRPANSRPVVAVAPTWNDWSGGADLAVALCAARPGWEVVYRPHWATAWRHPGAVERALGAGAVLDDPLDYPAGLLARADVLVTDVSGIGLLGVLASSARAGAGRTPLGIVQVDPPGAVAAGSAQFDPRGPEWLLRDLVGDRVQADTGAVADAVDRLLGDGAATQADGHRRAAHTLCHPYTSAASAARVGSFVAVEARVLGGGA